MSIYKQFEKQNLINNLAQYELYYQISLGYFISTFNSKELNQEIELQYALGSIYELLKELKGVENLEEILSNELKKQAAMDALQFFINENIEDVKKGKIEIENFVNQINDNEFFNDTMNDLCQNNINFQIKKWEEIITQDLAEAIMKSLSELE